jgi:beta-lactamase class A
VKSVGLVVLALVCSAAASARNLESIVPIESWNWEAPPFSEPELSAAPAPAPAATPVPAMAATPAPAVVPASVGLALQAKIDSLVKSLRKRGLLKPDERAAWSVYDITGETALAQINEDAPLQTASLIKPLVALAFFDAVAAGERSYTEEARRRMEAMIQESDNGDADWFLRQLGGPAAVQRRLKDKYGSILKDVSVVEYIPRSGRTYKNKASAHDYSRFLYALWTSALPNSEELKRVMSLPKRNRLMSGANDVPRDTLLYDKTGSTSRLCGDMGILVARGKDGKDYPYILVGVIEKKSTARHYMSWIHRRGDIIRQVSNLVYQTMADRHSLAGLGVAR